MNLDGKKGFTLIELMVAVSIFIIVVAISMGSILGAFDSNRKSRSLKTVLNNLNLAVESMSKEVRFGTDYHCGSGSVAVPQNCPGGDNILGFLSSDNEYIVYRLTGQTIEKRTGFFPPTFVPITAPEVSIDDLTFYVLGVGTGDTLQPKVIMKITGHAGAGRGRSDFILQTLVSQRSLDI